jgi:endonuclease III
VSTTLIAREHRLRIRIDQLLERCERAEVFLEIAEQENERLLERCSYYRSRARDLERSRDMWRDRFRATTHETLKAIDRARKRRKKVAA